MNSTKGNTVSQTTALLPPHLSCPHHNDSNFRAEVKTDVFSLESRGVKYMIGPLHPSDPGVRSLDSLCVYV